MPCVQTFVVSAGLASMSGVRFRTDPDGFRFEANPKRAATASTMRSRSATISAAVAPPRLMSASVWRLEMPAAPDRESLLKTCVLDEPCCGNFDEAGLCGKPGTDQDASAAILRSVSCTTMGFLKKLPALRQSASPCAATCPYDGGSRALPPRLPPASAIRSDPESNASGPDIAGPGSALG